MHICIHMYMTLYYHMLYIHVCLCVYEILPVPVTHVYFMYDIIDIYFDVHGSKFLHHHKQCMKYIERKKNVEMFLKSTAPSIQFYFQ